MNTKGLRRGFTLIELLIVIAIIAILAAVVFVALDPLNRFRDARDSARWTDVTAILSAIRVDQVDNGGSYVYPLNTSSVVGKGTVYQISNATTTTGCDTSCSAATSTANCVNLSKIVSEGYLGRLPVSPNGVGSWSSTLTGYHMTLNTNGSVTVGACEAEGGATISVTR